MKSITSCGLPSGTKPHIRLDERGKGRRNLSWRADYALSVMALAAALACFPLAGSAADGMWIGRADVGSDGMNWTEWNTAANWTNGIVPADGTSVANLTTATNRYVLLPAGTLAVKRVDGLNGKPSVLCGDGVLEFTSPSGNFQGLALYTSWRYWNSSLYEGPSSISICGDCTGLYGSTLWFGLNRVWLDRYATSSNPVRDKAAFTTQPSLRFHENGGMAFVAPCGSAVEQTSSWRQTEGSAFLAPVAAVGTLPVGTIVTGDGIPDDTYLKRIFPDGTIELSAAATNSAAANELTFAPFTSVSTVVLGAYAGFNTAGTKKLVVEKYRAEDEIRVSVSSFYAASGTAAGNGTFKIYTEEGFLPGIVSVRDNSTYFSYLTLENARLEICGNVTNMQLYVPNAAHTARVAVTGDLTRAVGVVKDVKGTLVKEGSGTLVVNQLGSGVDHLTVAAGGLRIVSLAATDVRIGTLTVKAGARFDVPEGGIACGALSVEEGAIVGGEGTLVYDTLAAGALRDIRVADAAGVTSSEPVDPTQPLAIDLISGAGMRYGENDDDILVFASNTTVEVSGSGYLDLLVEGGGGGGGADRGGGGGGGGVVYTQTVSVTKGLYGVTVGAGGLFGKVTDGRTHGQNGGNSSAFGIVALGGGGGGTQSSSPSPGENGFAGGCGGGAGAPGWGNTTASVGGAGIEGQGFAGGGGYANGSHWYARGGGGGGAGGEGVTVPQIADRLSGNGGPGRLCTIWGYHYYGGGGAGGNGDSGYATAIGGVGGGGDQGVTYSNGSIKPGGDGKPNTGGGGGGASSYVSQYYGPGGSGGSGVVIMRYRASRSRPTLAADISATGGAVKRKCAVVTHTFLTDGTFELTRDTVADILLVGGGGGGGASSGGGGGGGGVLYMTNILLEAGVYPVTIGAGGAGATGGGSVPSPGKDTVFGGPLAACRLLAKGGGGGGSRAMGTVGGSGGGGGAGYFYNNTTGGFLGGACWENQGYVGGRSTNVLSVAYSPFGGGGGGAGGSGADGWYSYDAEKGGADGRGGDGGVGRVIDITGEPVHYGGGGGGGSAKNAPLPITYVSAGGVGGGGRGGGCNTSVNPYIGYDGEKGGDGFGGGGGGSGSYGDGSGLGGAGGGGIVVVRYRVRPAGLVLSFK